MRILVAITAFAATMIVFFMSGQFHSVATPKPSDQTVVISSSPSLSATPRPKTASIINSIKALINSSPTSSSPSPSPSPALLGSSTPSPSAISGSTLPPLQRITLTPTPIATTNPVITPSTSTPSSQSTSTPSITPSPSPTALRSPTPSPSTPPASSATPSATPAPSPSPSASATPSATPTPSQASESIYIVSTIPLVYKQKGDAQLQIQTYPQASCGIKVTLPSGSVSGNNALITKSADDSGFITWIWSISWNTKTGTGKIDLNCIHDSQPYSKSVDFSITTP